MGHLNLGRRCMLKGKGGSLKGIKICAHLCGYGEDHSFLGHVLNAWVSSEEQLDNADGMNQ